MLYTPCNYCTTEQHLLSWLCASQVADLAIAQASSVIQGPTVGRVSNVWFNDCVVGKSGQSTNPIINCEDRPRTV